MTSRISRFLDWLTQRTQIVETEDGKFRPQIYTGWINGWEFLRSNADTSDWLLVSMLIERDPERCAQFQTEAEALAFMARFLAKNERLVQEHMARQSRERQSVGIKRVIK